MGYDLNFLLVASKLWLEMTNERMGCECDM